MSSWNFSEAEREYRRAIELNPNYAVAHHWYSVYLRMVRGRFDEAMAEIKLAQQLEPSPVISINVAQIHAAKGELETAIKESKKVLELDPNFPEAHWFLGLIYQGQGRYEEAITESKKAAELSGRQSRYLTNLGQCYALAGNKAQGASHIKRTRGEIRQA